MIEFSKWRQSRNFLTLDEYGWTTYDEGVTRTHVNTHVRKPFYDLYLFDDPAAATFASISAILDPMPLNSCEWEELSL